MALPILLLGVAVWMGWVQHDPFFWDTVQLGSKHAHHFYQNGLRWVPLPTAIDSGHPPVFGYYLACVWHLCGKSLPASHWAMFPFVAGIVILLYRMGRRLGGRVGWGAGLVVLAAADPVVAAQSSLVGPDVALLFFFLLAVEHLWLRRWVWASVGILGLCALSLRGMIVAVGLFVWQWYLQGGFERGWGYRLWRLSLIFAPGALFAAGFLWWHHRTAGWTGFHASSPWASAFEPARGLMLARNAFVLAWRWADFGRVFQWAALATLGWHFRKGGHWPQVRPWATLWLFIALVLAPSAIFYQNLSAHRYFLPGFAALHLLFLACLSAVPWRMLYKRLLFGVVALGLFVGNTWIYPHGIAMGWDATLAHRIYHSLRAEAMQVVEREGIPLERIGTAFPNQNTGEHLLLNGDERQWASFEPVANEYALISNVFNDIAPEQRSYLQQHRRLLWRAERRGVWMELYGPQPSMPVQ